MKKCRICTIEKPLSEFYSYRGYPHSYCKPCTLLKSEEWKRNNPEKAWLHDIKREYGLDARQYEELVERHGGKCAICGSQGRLHIDHDHTRRVVRGLLCPNCNHGIGKFRDNPQLLRSAAMYLDKSETFNPKENERICPTCQERLDEEDSGSAIGECRTCDEDNS